MWAFCIIYIPGSSKIPFVSFGDTKGLFVPSRQQWERGLRSRSPAPHDREARPSPEPPRSWFITYRSSVNMAPPRPLVFSVFSSAIWLTGRVNKTHVLEEEKQDFQFPRTLAGAASPDPSSAKTTEERPGRDKGRAFAPGCLP